MPWSTSQPLLPDIGVVRDQVGLHQSSPQRHRTDHGQPIQPGPAVSSRDMPSGMLQRQPRVGAPCTPSFATGSSTTLGRTLTINIVWPSDAEPPLLTEAEPMGYPSPIAMRRSAHEPTGRKGRTGRAGV